MPRKFPVTLLGAGIAVVLIITVLVVYGLPLMSGVHQPVNGTAIEAINVSVSPTSTGVLPTIQPAGVEILDDRTGETYFQIYHSQQDYIPGQTTVFTYSVTTHLLVRFNVTPEMFRHDKAIKLGLSTEQTIRENIPDPESFFEMDIVDATGSVIERQGFNGEFSSDTQQEFTVRSNGDLRFIMSGNKVNAGVQIFEAKT